MTRTRQRRERIARNHKRRSLMWHAMRLGTKRDAVRKIERLDPTLYDPPRLRFRAPGFIGFDFAYPDYTYQVPLRTHATWPRCIATVAV